MTLFRSLPTAALLLTLSAVAVPVVAQTPQAGPAPPAAQPASSQPSPSAILQPALASIQQALAMVRPEKWKAPGTVSAESVSDVGSIQRDLNSTLPPLLNAADSGSMTQLLPAYRNIEALYDVLVRVTQTSVLAAPAQQSAALQQATMDLQQARRDFGDLLDSAAQSQDRHLHEVQLKLTTLQSTPPPPAPVCPPPPPPAPKKPRPRAKPKPTTPSFTTTTPPPANSSTAH
jgi:hypothetical protein